MEQETKRNDAICNFHWLKISSIVVDCSQSTLTQHSWNGQRMSSSSSTVESSIILVKLALTFDCTWIHWSRLSCILTHHTRGPLLVLLPFAKHLFAVTHISEGQLHYNIFGTTYLPLIIVTIITVILTWIMRIFHSQWQSSEEKHFTRCLTHPWYQLM